MKNGRGPTPDAENGVARAMVLRLGVGGTRRAGRAAPRIRSMGRSSIRKSIPAFPGEGRAILAFDAFETRLDDGEKVTMRRPRLSLRDLAYGPIGGRDADVAAQRASVFGLLGLLEAVRDDEIISPAAGPGGGRPNRVHDMAAGRIALGRFGLKANQPTLRQQIAAAFAEDIGVASALFPPDRLRARSARLPRGGRARDAELSKSSSGLRAGLCSRSRRSGAARADRRCARGQRGAALFAGGRLRLLPPRDVAARRRGCCAVR